MINQLITVFLTGLLAGGLSCAAVQGGLLAATIAQREEEHLKEKAAKGNALPILTFLIAKLAAYTLLGLLLGWFGSLFQLSLTLKILMQVLVAVFMLGSALSILNVHPIFRYFIIQPPKFLTRIVRKQSKSADIFAPGILGAFTIFIPCGTTQAMMALSIASGSPISGALILFAFVLGTSPVFFLLGYFATKLGNVFHEKFMKVLAFAIIFLAIFNLDNAIALSGSNLTLENFAKGAWCTVSFCDNTPLPSAANAQALTDLTIEIGPGGYTPNELTAKAGADITLHLKNDGGGGCAQAFTIPSLGVQRLVSSGQNDTVTFKAPGEATDIAFMCSMGMYRGVIHVL
ncbi:sulfite exporter TauE/SafE family protein [Patescibacteria group bacterium]|nr:sulfite exporter TauE/SafE family protein [Patescibacteria group bacterium]